MNWIKLQEGKKSIFELYLVRTICQLIFNLRQLFGERACGTCERCISYEGQLLNYDLRVHF